jgi:site-specific DNA recombinase
MRPEQEWITIRTPALIETPLFERAQRQLKDNSKLARRNRKNQYLLSGKIRCICGLPRCGEGPQKGRHLYYRCSSRQYNYPLPPSCTERGINARIADVLVWEKLAELMSSPELMARQVQRLMTRQRAETKRALDVPAIGAELIKLRAQEDRYAKAYAAGLFDLDRLKEYAGPLRIRIAGLEQQLAQSRSAEPSSAAVTLPAARDIDAFAITAAEALRDLNFDAKRAIVTRVISKVVGTQKELNVSGHLAVSEYVKDKLDDRYGVSATRHFSNDNFPVLPFEFTIELPAPNYQTVKGCRKTPAAA